MSTTERLAAGRGRRGHARAPRRDEDRPLRHPSAQYAGASSSRVSRPPGDALFHARSGGAAAAPPTSCGPATRTSSDAAHDRHRDPTNHHRKDTTMQLQFAMDTLTTEDALDLAGKARRTSTSSRRHAPDQERGPVGDHRDQAGAPRQDRVSGPQERWTPVSSRRASRSTPAPTSSHRARRRGDSTIAGAVKAASARQGRPSST